MSDIFSHGLRLQRTGSDTVADLFLCHNRHDADLVALIAEALEIETGTPFFLDRFAIPTGVEFLPHIENALTTSMGCAIFLGEHGWGETHLWEAERALERYRADPDFRLIPIALPGIKDEDMVRLGNGSVFNEINRATLSGTQPDQEELVKLAAALSGTAAPQFRGPANLTPYLLRRDADNWRNAKDHKEKRSILYSGAKLKEARAIALASPDFAVIGEIHPFLDAAEQRQTTTLRRITISAVIASVLVASLGAAALYTAFVAEQRRLESQSRALAITAPNDSSPGRQLLIALEAHRLSPTAEAQGVVIQMLDKWGQLRAEHKLFHRITTMAANPTQGIVWVATAGGEIYKIEAHGAPVLAYSVKTDVTALYPVTNGVLVGSWRGHVMLAKGSKAPTTIFKPFNETDSTKDIAIKTLLTDPKGKFIVAGDGQGRLRILQLGETPTEKLVDLTDEIRIDRMTLSPDGSRLIVTTGSNLLVVIDTTNWTEMFRRPLPNTTLDIAFIDDQTLVWVTSSGALQRAKLKGQNITIEGSHQFPGFMSRAKIIPADKHVILGWVNGTIEVRDIFGQTTGLKRTLAHTDSIKGIAFLPKTNTIISGSSSGGLAQWTLVHKPGFELDLPNLPLGGTDLAISPTGAIFAATMDDLTGAVWRISNEDRVQILDLVKQTRMALGPDSLSSDPNQPDEQGYFHSGRGHIQEIAITDQSVVWSTVDRDVFWQRFDRTGPPVKIAYDSVRKPYLLDVSDKSGLIAIAEDGASELQLFDSLTGVAKPTISLPYPLRSFTFAPDGKTLAIGLEDGRVIIGDTKGDQIKILPFEHDSSANILTYLNNAQDIISVGDGTGLLRGLLAQNLRSEKKTQLQSRLPGFAATDIATDDALNLIAVGDANGNVTLWRSSDLRFVTALNFDNNPIASVAFDKYHKRIIALTGGGKLRAWTLDPTLWTNIICAKVGRSLNTDEWDVLIPGDEYAPACASYNRKSEPQ